MDKSCGHEKSCNYQYLGSLGFMCAFSGYCDYQAPRDSRNWVINNPDTGNTNNDLTK